MKKPKTAKDLQEKWLEVTESILKDHYKISKDIRSENRIIFISDHNEVAKQILKALKLM